MELYLIHGLIKPMNTTCELNIITHVVMLNDGSDGRARVVGFAISTKHGHLIHLRESSAWIAIVPSQLLWMYLY